MFTHGCVNTPQQIGSRLLTMVTVVSGLVRHKCIHVHVLVHVQCACLLRRGKSLCPRGVCLTIFLRRLHWSIGREGVIPDRRSQSHNLSGKV